MRIYSESSEEALRSRRLLKEWADEGLLSKEQYQRLEQDTPCDLRVTNVFLRLVLFFFTLIVVAAGAGLFFMVFLSRPSQETTGIFLLVFAGICYAAAEIAGQARLYRYGIEEALAVCAVAFLCAGIEFLFFSGVSTSSRGMESVVPAVGSLASLWIWYRFHLWYAFLAAMMFAVFLPGYWTPSRSGQLVFIAAFYAVGLVCIAATRSRHRFDVFEGAFPLSEAFLWLGFYVAFNLKISALSLPSGWLNHTWAASDFAGPFYWTTWAITWCLPPLILVRGIRQRDRYVMAAGAIAAVLTFVTNKPYLGWQRHTWDPMLLGVALTGAAWFLRRWLDGGAGGVRYGFTAARLSGKDKQTMDVGSAVLGLATPHSIPSTVHSDATDARFGGGSGGGGASGDF